MEDALFVGRRAPTCLILGLYNKIIKIEGHDRANRTEIGQSNVAGQSSLGSRLDHAGAGIETSDYRGSQ